MRCFCAFWGGAVGALAFFRTRVNRSFHTNLGFSLGPKSADFITLTIYEIASSLFLVLPHSRSFALIRGQKGFDLRSSALLTIRFVSSHEEFLVLSGFSSDFGLLLILPVFSNSSAYSVPLRFKILRLVLQLVLIWFANRAFLRASSLPAVAGVSVVILAF
jgi:hypothetical protein